MHKFPEFDINVNIQIIELYMVFIVEVFVFINDLFVVFCCMKFIL